jgi:hypothetical protein
MVRPQRGTVLLVVLTVVSAISGARSASAQDMGYSIMSAMYTDGDSVIAYSDIDDYYGCFTGVEYELDELYSPSGRYTSGTGGTSMAIADDFGTWTGTTTWTVDCQCLNHVPTFTAQSQGVAADTTIEVKYTFSRADLDQVHQIKNCVYSICGGYPTTCGSGFVDTVGLADACAPGIDSVWHTKSFIGITYRCEEISHVHLSSAPC